MVKQYETVFILTPVLSEDQVKETVKKFRDYLLSKGAEIVNEENWGLRKLAYKIKKKSTGFYILFEYRIDTQKLKEFETQLKRDERVLRFLTVYLDKYAIEFNEKRRKKLAEQPVEQAGPQNFMFDQAINNQ